MISLPNIVKRNVTYTSVSSLANQFHSSSPAFSVHRDHEIAQFILKHATYDNAPFTRRSAKETLQKPILSPVSDLQIQLQNNQSLLYQNDPFTWSPTDLFTKLRTNPIHNLDTARHLVYNVWKLQHRGPNLDIIDVVGGFGALAQVCLELPNVRQVHTYTENVSSSSSSSTSTSTSTSTLKDLQKRYPQFLFVHHIMLRNPQFNPSLIPSLSNNVFCTFHFPQTSLSGYPLLSSFLSKYALPSLLQIALRPVTSTSNPLQLGIGLIDKTNYIKLYRDLPVECNQIVSPLRSIPLAQLFYNAAPQTYFEFPFPLGDHVFTDLPKEKKHLPDHLKKKHTTTKNPEGIATILLEPKNDLVNYDQKQVSLAYAIASLVTPPFALKKSWIDDLSAYIVSARAKENQIRQRALENHCSFNHNIFLPSAMLSRDQWITIAQVLGTDAANAIRRKQLDTTLL